ncbi:MAG: type III-A CRISPR-associated RAMP protein Csm5 [Nitrospirae bacterium]|nr:type III-A CRISPR-associated RAMP protein Csm5 [Nitrospirota bacterium]
MDKPLKIRLHVLSPIHIGCDDVYEPTSFVIDTDKKKLVSFDPLAFIRTLTDRERQELTAIAQKGTLPSIIEIYRFIFNKRSSIKGNEISISQGIIDRYISVKSLALNDRNIKQELNNFIIPRTAYHPYNNTPYIPGSSLKGSVRTGFLSMLALGGGTYKGLDYILAGNKPNNSITNRRNARELELQLLEGSFAEDPFRMLKVSDLLPHTNVRTRVLYAINRRKLDGSKQTRGIPQIFEIIEAGSSFEGVINLQSPPSSAGIKKPIDSLGIRAFFRAVHKHYARNYGVESKIAEQLHFKMPRPLKSHGDMKETAFLIRVGKHSGAESVTIEGNRQILVRGPRGSKEIKDHATTIWLASEQAKPENNNGLFPFGWAVMEVLN